jgi:ATP-binding cassette subfamily B protein
MKKNILEARAYKFRDMVLLFFRVSPFYWMISVVNRLLGAAKPTITIFATAAFIEAALAVGKGEKPLEAVYLPIVVLMGVMVYATLVQNLLMRYLTVRGLIYGRNILMPQLLSRVAQLEYRHIENQDSADLIRRVTDGFYKKIAECFDCVANLTEDALSALGIIISVTTKCWWAGLIIIASLTPLFVIGKKAGERSYEASREVTKIRRRVEYLSNDVLKSRDAVEERTVYGYTAAVNATFLERFHKARLIELKVTAVNFARSKAGAIFSAIIAMIVIGAMIPSAAKGGLEFPMFVALIGGIMSLVGSLSWGINGQIQTIARNREYLRDVEKFCALSVEADATAEPTPGVTFETIEFCNVSFTYPGTEKKILDGVSFTIRRGQHYSFVGVNGAGKTTITKLLTGLYSNYDGEIYVDGKRLRTFTPAELKGLSTVVYQDFARYSFSLFDNIAIGAIGSSNAGIEVTSAVMDAVRLIGLSGVIEKLPEGIHTKLGKIYTNGVDLSGGEWQRVAMARSLVSDAPLRILDEPTAALDPVSESRVYSQFEEISQGKTTLFISHRLGSTKLADTIFVLSDGKITEQGTHRVLMEQRGLYAQMYAAQADWYKETEAVHA